jgi:hypothetical protein
VRRAAILGLTAAAGCWDPLLGQGAGDPDASPPLPGWPDFSAPCELDPPSPRGLVVTTTDFASGAVATVDAATRAVTPDVALGSTDAIPFAADGLVYVVHRWGLDYVDVLDPAQGWASLAEIPLDAAAEEGSPNPQAIAFAEGRGWVTLLARPEVATIDLTSASTAPLEEWVSLAAFADADGSPEAGHIVACGDLLVVALAFLDAHASYAPHGGDALVAVDVELGRPYELTLPFLGGFAKQLRRDPGDASGRSLLALTIGVERLDLVGRAAQWVVSPESFAAQGIAERLLPQSFDIDDDGSAAYIAAYTDGYDEVVLYRVDLRLGPDAPLEPFAGSFDSVERSLEVIGDDLWYGSTHADAPGLWLFDLRTVPPTVQSGPLSTGLPPYALVTLP